MAIDLQNLGQYLSPDGVAAVKKAQDTVASMNAGGGTNPTPGTTAAPSNDPSNPAFLEQITNRLIGNGAVVSSQDTPLETKLNDIIASTKAGADANSKLVESQYNRQEADLAVKNDNSEQALRESQRGYAVNMAAYNQLKNDNEKSMRDLEQRKQELILQGQSDAASKISDLQIQTLQFQEQQKQQVFTNLLSLANLGQQAQQNKFQQQQQSFAEKQAINSIALKYGLDVKPGDTIDTITSRAAPFSSQEEQLSLAKTKADINNANAQAKKALQGDNVPLDALTASAMASTIKNLTLSGNINQANTLMDSVNKTYGASGFNTLQEAVRQQNDIEYTEANLKKNILENHANGDSAGTVLKNIADNPFMSPEQKQKAMDIANNVYATTEAPTAASVLSGIGYNALHAGELLGRFIGFKPGSTFTPTGIKKK